MNELACREVANRSDQDGPTRGFVAVVRYRLAIYQVFCVAGRNPTVLVTFDWAGTLVANHRDRDSADNKVGSAGLDHFSPMGCRIPYSDNVRHAVPNYQKLVIDAGVHVSTM